jgi:3-methyladenine DNA glycosylase AlkD
MRYSDVMKELRRLSDPVVAKKLERFGIPTVNALGISAPLMRALAKKIGTNQEISLRLWSSGTLEGRVLATLVGNPERVTRRQMEQWARQIDSWGVCDACCGVLFIRTPYALEKAFAWSKREREFTKRAGFVLMAAAAVHRKELKDEEFIPMLEAIQREAGDGRHFVKKAANWALRQIGKRNRRLNSLAIKTARDILSGREHVVRWIASDALRELTSERVQRKLRERSLRSRPNRHRR